MTRAGTALSPADQALARGVVLLQDVVENHIPIEPAQETIPVGITGGNGPLGGTG